MSSRIPFGSMVPGVGWLWLLLLALLLCGSAFATCPPDSTRYQDIDLTNCRPERTYGKPVGSSVDDGQIAVCNVDFRCARVDWTCNPSCPFTVNGLTVNVPGLNASPSAVANIGGKLPAADTTFTLTVATHSVPGTNCPPIQCTQPYRFHVNNNGSGWGDVHIITEDSVAYDFQSAGEFTALRGKGLEIQTRQTPVATAPAVASEHTGLTSCVSIYTAVAARVGRHRVTYQPNISGVPDPSGLQLRVDGKLRKLGPEGIDLKSEGPSDEDEDEYERARRGKYQPRQHSTAPAQGAIVKRPSAGRIVQLPAGAIEIDYADGTKLVVTPAWWDSQKKWYLNVNVAGWGTTTATKGIMGLIKDGWLPALPDGRSLGPRPDAGHLHDRYVQLYKKFADAWRVTEDTSLFDYAPYTSTKTFTNREWPEENPSSCAIEGEPTAQGIPVPVAEKHCSAVVDKNNKANCIFDVKVTGNPGFAEIYQISERLQPGLTETTVKDDTDPTQTGDSVTFTATVLPALARGGGIPAGTVQFIVDDSKAGAPVTLDTIGRAAWSTSNLQAGEHHVVAKYNPTGFGEPFLASSSPKICHTVIGEPGLGRPSGPK